MGNIALSIGQINITGYLKIRIREGGPSGPVVIDTTVPPPVPAIQNLFYSNLNDLVHYIEFRESADGVSLGILLSTFVYDVTTSTLMSERRFYRGGGMGGNDPATGSVTITDPYFLNKIISGVFKAGNRYLIPGVEYTVAGDTVTLISSFDVPSPEIYEGEILSVEINYTTSTGSNTSNSNFPKSIIEITTDTTLNTTHVNTLMEINGSGGVLSVVFPDFSLIPDNSKFGFTTDNGSQTHLAIVCGAGAYVQADGVNRPIIWLGKGEQITLMKKSGYMRILSRTGDHHRVGMRVSTDGTPPINSLPETGGWYLKTAYPRLWQYINSLPLADVVASADDSALTTSRTKWNAGSTKFWVPDRADYFDRISNNARRSGDTQLSQVGQFVLSVTKGNGFTGNPGAGDIDKFSYGSANPTVRTLTLNAGQETRSLNTATFIYRIY